MPSFPECQAAAQFSAARDFRSRSLAFGKFVVFAALFFAFLQVLSIAMRPVRLSGIGWQALAGNLSVAVAALSATAVLSPAASGLSGWAVRIKRVISFTGLAWGWYCLRPCWRCCGS